MPIKLAKGIKRHRTRRVERKAKRGTVNGTTEIAPPEPRRLSVSSRSSSSSSSSDYSLYSDESDDEAVGSGAGSRHHEDDDENIAQDIARDVGKSLEKSGEALASGKLTNALWPGYRNISLCLGM
jgi:hypothetical protein